MVVIDANNLIMGRVASFAVKKAILGEKVIIVNSEEAVMTGKKNRIIAKFRQKREIGSVTKGPFYPRMPDRILRRAVRGMLPYKQKKGRDAFKRIMCYIGIPDEFKNEKAETMKEADISKVKDISYVKLREISRILGAKI